MKKEQTLSGIDLIAQKRAKHVSKGWTKEHDKLHKNGELAIVAADIALRHTTAYVNSPSYIPRWGLQKKDLINRLAIAGSLIAAEIDRLTDYTPIQTEENEVQGPLIGDGKQTQEPIWHGGAMPTHWMPLPKKQKA